MGDPIFVNVHYMYCRLSEKGQGFKHPIVPIILKLITVTADTLLYLSYYYIFASLHLDLLRKGIFSNKEANLYLFKKLFLYRLFQKFQSLNYIGIIALNNSSLFIDVAKGYPLSLGLIWT